MLLNAAAVWGYNQFQKAPKDNILSRVYDMSPQSYAFDKQSQWSEKMAIDAFNREAAYNSPTAQMQRYKEAGLNPNLMYGQGNSGNVSASTPSASHAPPNSIPQMIPMLMQVAGFMKEMQVKDAQIANLNVRSSQGEASTLLTNERLELLKQQFPHLVTKLVNEIGLQGSQLETQELGRSKMNQEIANLLKTGTLIGENITGAKNRNAMYPLERERLNETINNLVRQGVLLSSDADIRQQEKQKRDLENQLLKAQTMFVSQGITNPQQFMQFIGSLLIKAISVK